MDDQRPHSKNVPAEPRANYALTSFDNLAPLCTVENSEKMGSLNELHWTVHCFAIV